MIKKMSIVALTLVLLLGSASMALASENGFGAGEGYLGNQGADLSHEAFLALKLARIDELVDEGRITAEEATAFKAAITERMEACEDDCTGEGRPDDAERMNIGFGFGRNGGQGNGEVRGEGERYGTRGNGLRLAECAE